MGIVGFRDNGIMGTATSSVATFVSGIIQNPNCLHLLYLIIVTPRYLISYDSILMSTSYPASHSFKTDSRE